MQSIKFEMGELLAFVTTAEKASFRLAAEALYLSPPALSRRVNGWSRCWVLGCWSAPPAMWR
jgi:hypothetical protein